MKKRKLQNKEITNPNSKCPLCKNQGNVDFIGQDFNFKLYIPAKILLQRFF